MRLTGGALARLETLLPPGPAARIDLTITDDWYAARAAALGKDKQVREALKQERREEEQEERLITAIITAEGRLANPDERLGAMQDLRARWKQMRAAANGESDTAERRVARRISRALLASANERSRDPEYRKFLEEQRGLFPRGR